MLNWRATLTSYGESLADDEERIRAVYDKTGRRCRYCEKQLSMVNYGTRGSHGAWAIDHSRPVSKGGTDHLNNLFPACYDCNEEKGDQQGDSFLKRKRESTRPPASPSDCFVATAVCSREDRWVMQSLKGWRDKALLPNGLGRVLVLFYYQIGPVLARLIRCSATIREMIKPLLRGLARRIGDDRSSHSDNPCDPEKVYLVSTWKVSIETDAPGLDKNHRNQLSVNGGWHHIKQMCKRFIIRKQDGAYPRTGDLG